MRFRVGDRVIYNKSGTVHEVVGSTMYNNGESQTLELKNMGRKCNAQQCSMAEVYDPEFRKGQKIVCINSKGCKTIEDDKIYTVKFFYQKNREGRKNFVYLEKTKRRYFACRFKEIGVDKEFSVGKISEVIEENINRASLCEPPANFREDFWFPEDETRVAVQNIGDKKVYVWFCVMHNWFSILSDIHKITKDPTHAEIFMENKDISAKNISKVSKNKSGVIIEFDDGSCVDMGACGYTVR